MIFLNCGKVPFDIWKFLQDFGPTVISLFAIFTTFWVTRETLKSQAKQNIKALNAKKDLEARQLIQRKLDEFYGPLIHQRMKSTKLYDKLSAKYRGQDEKFSILTYLLEEYQFEKNDKVLLEQIIQLGVESEKLIQEKSGLIDDSQLRLEILPRVTVHFLLLHLAYNGNLKGNSDEFKDLTYPNELIAKLEERKARLERDLDNLTKREN